MKKFMKNKKLLTILAMVLMVSLVVGMGAMTYAKYVSNYDGGSGTATAAKWGFVVTANTDNLFGTQYKSDDSDTYATVTETGDVVVKAEATGNIVAPGTMGYLSIQVSGMAEVLAQLNVSIDLTENITDGATTNAYEPIEWTLVAADTAPAAGATWVKDPETITTTATINPGETANGNYRLYWRWAFTTSADNDKKDTVIGAKAAGEDLADVNAMTSQFH